LCGNVGITIGLEKLMSILNKKLLHA
jgi:hypothetical protein